MTDEMTDDEFNGVHRAFRYIKSKSRVTTAMGPGVRVTRCDPNPPYPDPGASTPKKVGKCRLTAFTAPRTFVYTYFATPPTPAEERILSALADACIAQGEREVAFAAELQNVINDASRSSYGSSFGDDPGPKLSRGDMIGIASALARGVPVRVRRDVFDNTFGKRR